MSFINIHILKAGAVPSMCYTQNYLTEPIYRFNGIKAVLKYESDMRRIFMSNEELKNYAKKHKVFQYQIAEHLGITESKLSVLFRKPVDEKMQKAFIQAVDALSDGDSTKGRIQPVRTEKTVITIEPPSFADLFNSVPVPQRMSTVEIGKEDVEF